MKNILLTIQISAFFSILFATAPQVQKTEQKKEVKKEQIVYVCKGKGAKKYHSTSRCKGLSNCKSGVAPVSIGKATNEGKTPCKICH